MVTEHWTLAIDFGTSCTVVATRTRGRPAEVIEIDGDRRVPSVMMIADDGRIVIGRAAEENAAALPTRVLRASKARLGDPSPIVLAGRPYQATALVAELLAYVYEEARRMHGTSPASTRLTYPVSWGGHRRQQLLRAADLAGLPMPILVPEPIAAAIWYADLEPIPDGGHVLVYDLGGGTFDCALLTSSGSGLELVGRPSGERQLGGELFDELLANEIGARLPTGVWELLQVGGEQIWRQAWVGLLRDARRAKELLSTQPVADILVALPHGIIELRLTRADLESVVRPHLVDSIQFLRQTCADAGVGERDLHAIYLVGGASRTPLVEALIREAFPLTQISKRADPKTVVALGATSETADGELQAWLLPPERLTDPVRVDLDPPAVTALQHELPLHVPSPTTVREDGVPEYGPRQDAASGSGSPHKPRGRRRALWLALSVVIVLAAASVVAALLVASDDPVGPGTIVFSSDRDGDYELFTMSPSGGDLHQLTDNDRRDTFPAWSPDGRRLAWTQNGDIIVANADGSGATNLTADLELGAEKPAWTPNGRSIVYVQAVDGPPATFEIWQMNADGSDKAALVTYASQGRSVFDPAVASNGDLYYSSRLSATHVELCRLSAARCLPVLPSNASNVTDEVIALAPRGDEISFSRSIDAVNYDVMLSDLRGGAVVDITLRAEDAAPTGTSNDPTGDSSSNDYGSSLSPDATSIAMVRQPRGEDTEIWVVDGAGAFHRLTDNDTQDIDPDWSDS